MEAAGQGADRAARRRDRRRACCAGARRASSWQLGGMDMAEGPWVDGTQACEGADIGTFYVGIGASAAEAKDICLSGCPFLARCREWGIAHEDYGVWGGMSVEDRRDYRHEHGIHIRAPQTDVGHSNGARKAWAR